MGQRCFRHSVDHVGFHKPRRDRIYGNSFTPQFARQTFSEGNDAALGDCIVGLAEISRLANNRRDINYASRAISIFPGYHILEHKLSCVKNSIEVDPHYFVPHCFGHFEKRSIPINPRVINQDRDVAQFLRGFFDHFLHFLAGGDIGLVARQRTPFSLVLAAN